MQETVPVTDQRANRNLLNSLYETPLWYWGLVAFLGVFVVGAMCAAGYMINQGLGVTGLNRPVFWGFFITNFVFWIGISHAGVMLSAILRLSKAEWRRPATRAAEVLTVFSLMTAMLMPLIHTGRPWRIFYWVFPYDFARGVYMNVRSALVWDPSAVFTYLTSSILFVYVALLPDLAVIRDRSTGPRRIAYSILCLGWRGTPRQWKLQIIAGILLSALILPVFVSVHSIVSFDFSMVIAAKSWHSTIFPPYFVIGAVHSGGSGGGHSHGDHAVDVQLAGLHQTRTFRLPGTAAHSGGHGMVLLLRHRADVRPVLAGGRRDSCKRLRDGPAAVELVVS